MYFLLIILGFFNGYVFHVCVGALCHVLQVRYMKIIEKSGYQALPWVRYITQSGGKFRARDQAPV